ncbi:MAG: NAD-dependent epimerase/dehydratase family protein [Pseudomonadota bacterium]
MTVLVTGGAGFVGRPLCEALLARGETVRVLDLAEEGVPGTEHLRGSIIDAEVVQQAMVGVSCVFHLAGNAQLWAPDPGVFDIVNRAGTETVLAAAEAVRVERFVHCSSLTTLIGRKNPKRPVDLKEAHRPEPDDMLGAYPRSKLLAERAVEAAAARGFNAVIALPTEPLGPGDEAITPPTRMLIDFLNGANPAYMDAILNFVPVRSLAEGLLACADTGRAGERYLLGGENIGMGRLLAKLEALTGRIMPTLKLPFAVALAAGVVETAIADRVTGKPPKAPLTGVRLASRPARFSSAKAKAELGWEPAPLEPALKETIAWLEAKGLVKEAP